MSNRVVTFVRKWVAEYCATTAAMNDLCSSLAKELAIQRIKVNTPSSSSIVIGKLKSLAQRAGLIVSVSALARLRHHYGLARSAKSRKVPNDVPSFQNLTEANLKHQKRSKKMLGVLTIGLCSLTGCSFSPDFAIPSPVVSDGKVYFYTLCHFNAVNANTREMKWTMETVKSKDNDWNKDNE